jgi:hypothetical protein
MFLKDAGSINFAQTLLPSLLCTPNFYFFEKEDQFLFMEFTPRREEMLHEPVDGLRF